MMRSKAPVPPGKALERLENLCARSEQCEYEVRQKLARWQVSADDADKIVDSLIERRFVDNERYAASFVRDKYRFSRWGRIKIAMALRQKRIDRHTIEQALDEIDEDEYTDILRHLIKAKAASIAEPDTYEGTNQALPLRRLKRLRAGFGGPHTARKQLKKNFRN